MPQTIMANNGDLRNQDIRGDVSGHDETSSPINPDMKSPNDHSVYESAENPKMAQQFFLGEDKAKSKALAGGRIHGDCRDQDLSETVLAPEPNMFPAQTSCNDLLDDIASVIAADTGQEPKHHEGSSQYGHFDTQALNTAKKTAESANIAYSNKRKTKRKNSQLNKQKGEAMDPRNFSDSNNNAVGCLAGQHTSSHISPNYRASIETDSPEVTTRCVQSEPTVYHQLQAPPHAYNNPQSSDQAIGTECGSRCTIPQVLSPLSLVEKTGKISLEDDSQLSPQQTDDDSTLKCEASITQTRPKDSYTNGVISSACHSESHQKQLSPLPNLDHAPMSCGSEVSIDKTPIGVAGEEEKDTGPFDHNMVPTQNDVGSAFERQISWRSQGVTSTETCSSDGRQSQNLSSASTLEARGGHDLLVPRRERSNLNGFNNKECDLDPDVISLDGEGEFEEELCSLELRDESILTWDDSEEEELRSKGRGRKKTPKVVRPDKPRLLVPKVHGIHNSNPDPDAIVRQLLYNADQLRLTDSDYLPPTIPVMLEATGPNLYKMKFCPATASSCEASNRKISPHSESVASRRSLSPASTRRGSPSSSRGRSTTPTYKVMPSGIGSVSNITTMDECTPAQAYKVMPTAINSVNNTVTVDELVHSQAAPPRSFASSAAQQSSNTMWNGSNHPRRISPVSPVLSPPESQFSAISPSKGARSAATESTALTNDTRSSCGNLSYQHSPRAPTISPPTTLQEMCVAQSPSLLSFSTAQSISIQMDGPIFSRRDFLRRPQPYNPIQLQQQQYQPPHLEQQQTLEQIFLAPVNPPSFQPTNTRSNHDRVTNTIHNTSDTKNAVPVYPTNAMPSHTGTQSSDLDMLLSPSDDMQQFIDSCIGPQSNQITALTKQLADRPLQDRQALSRHAPKSSGDLPPMSNFGCDKPVLPTVIGLSGTPVAMQPTASKRKVSAPKSSHDPPSVSNPSLSLKSEQHQAKGIYRPVVNTEQIEGTSTSTAIKCPKAHVVQERPAVSVTNPVKAYQGPSPAHSSGLKAPDEKRLPEAGLAGLPLTNSATNSYPLENMGQNRSSDYVQSWVNELPSMNFMEDHSMQPNWMDDGSKQITNVIPGGMEQESGCNSSQQNHANYPGFTLNDQQLQLLPKNIISAYFSSLGSCGKNSSLEEYLLSNSTGIKSGSGELNWLHDLLTNGRSKSPDGCLAQALKGIQRTGVSPPPLAELSYRDVADVLKFDKSNRTCFVPAGPKVVQNQSTVLGATYLQGNPQNTCLEQQQCLPARNGLHQFQPPSSAADHTNMVHPQQFQHCSPSIISALLAQQSSGEAERPKFDGVQQPPVQRKRGAMYNFPNCPDTLPTSDRSHQARLPSQTSTPSVQDLPMLSPTNALQMTNQNTLSTCQNGKRLTNNCLPQNFVQNPLIELLPPCGPPSDVEMRSSSLTDPSDTESNTRGIPRLGQGGSTPLCFPDQNLGKTNGTGGVRPHFLPPDSGQNLQKQCYLQYQGQFDQTQMSPVPQFSQLEHPHKWTNQQPSQFAVPKAPCQNVPVEIVTSRPQHVLEWIKQQQVKPTSNNDMSMESVSEAQSIPSHLRQGQYPENISLEQQKSTVSQHPSQHVYQDKILQLQQLQEQQQQQMLYLQQQEAQQPPAMSNLKLTKENLQSYQNLLRQKQHIHQAASSNHVGSTSNLSQISHQQSSSGAVKNQCPTSDMMATTKLLIYNYVQNNACTVSKQLPANVSHQTSRVSYQASVSQQRVPGISERSDRRGRSTSPSPSATKSNRESSPSPFTYMSRGCSPSPHRKGPRKSHRSPSPNPSSQRSGRHSPVPEQAQAATVKSSCRSPSPSPPSNRSSRHSPSPSGRSSRYSDGAQRLSQDQLHQFTSQDQTHYKYQDQHHQNSQDHLHQHHRHQKHQQHHQSSTRTYQWLREQQQQQQHQLQQRPLGPHQPLPLPQSVQDKNPVPQGPSDTARSSPTNQKPSGNPSSAVRTKKVNNSTTQGTKPSGRLGDNQQESVGDAGPITLSSGSDGVGRLAVPGTSDVGDTSIETSMSSGPGNSDLEGDTILHMLCHLDIPKEEIPKIAQDHLQHIDTRNRREETPLFVAVQSSRVDVARFLLSHRANPNLFCLSYPRGSPVNQSCLHEAVTAGDEEMVKLLLTPGYNTVVDAVRPSTGLTPLMLALELHSHEKNKQRIVTMLIGQGASLFTKDSTGKTPLMFAIQSGDVALVEYMLKHVGADKGRQLVTMVTKRGLSCLHFASERNNLDGEKKRRMMRRIILAGGDPSHRNNEGDSARDWDRINIEAVLADLRRA